MADTIQVTDIVNVLVKGKNIGYFLITNISPDHKSGWWLVTGQLMNRQIEFTWLLDNCHLAQEEFTMDNEPRQLKLYARVPFAQ